MKKFLHCLVLLSATAAILSGCATPNAKPFQEFSKATTEIDGATTKALKETTSQSKEALIDSVGDRTAFNHLKLYFKNEPGAYRWGNRSDGTWEDAPPSGPDKLLADPHPDAQPGTKPAIPSQWMNYYYKPSASPPRLTNSTRSSPNTPPCWPSWPGRISSPTTNSKRWPRN